MFLGRTPNPEGGDDRLFTENDSSVVVRDLEAGKPIDYFFIKLTLGNTVLQPVNLKAGPRNPGRNLDIAEVEAGGRIVGNAEVTR